MRLILNVTWLVFGGLWLALDYLAAALICFLDWAAAASRRRP